MVCINDIITSPCSYHNLKISTFNMWLGCRWNYIEVELKFYLSYHISIIEKMSTLDRGLSWSSKTVNKTSKIVDKMSKIVHRPICPAAIKCNYILNHYFIEEITFKDMLYNANKQLNFQNQNFNRATIFKYTQHNKHWLNI